MTSPYLDSERNLQNRILEAAKALGWLTYHTHDSRRSAPGYPDLTLVRSRRLIFAELKSVKGKVTAEQQEWLDRLSATGAECYTWRPADLQTALTILTADRYTPTP